MVLSRRCSAGPRLGPSLKGVVTSGIQQTTTNLMCIYVCVLCIDICMYIYIYTYIYVYDRYICI